MRHTPDLRFHEQKQELEKPPLRVFFSLTAHGPSRASRLLFLAVLVAFPFSVSAQEPQQDNTAEIRQLKIELDRIATRLATLEAAGQPAAPPPASTRPVQPPPAGEAVGHENMPGMPPPATPVGQEEAGQDSLDHGGPAIEIQIPLVPEIRIRGFGDVRFRQANQNLAIIDNAPDSLTPPTQGGESTFGLGLMDLFITSRISQQFSYLAEVGFEADEGSNGIGVDLERAQITWKPSETFSLQAGRTHAMLGYYNTAFHHGTWFQTTVDRPRIFQFEDSGGILPIHNVGISAVLRVPHNPLGLHLFGEVGNGRQTYSLAAGATPANVLADHTGKSTNLGGFLRPEKVSGLQAGFNWYQASLTPSQVPGAAPYYRQNIFVAHAVYIRPSFEFMAEGVAVRDRARYSPNPMYTSGGYVQVSKAFESVRPFARFQWLNPNFADPNNAWTGHWVGPNVGVRWDINTYIALKGEYDYYNWRNFSDSPSGAQVLPLQHKTIQQLWLQLAYTF